MTILRTLGCLVSFAIWAAAQQFYPDDPLEFEPPPRNVRDLQKRKLSDYYDLLSHQFGKVGERHPPGGPPIRAQAVSTLGEPLQGVWWMKRHYYQRMTLDELKRGPGPRTLPSTAGKWTVAAVKNEGVTPGFIIRDSEQRRFFIKFDPLTNPEMATSADAITSRLFHAMGFWAPHTNVVYFDPDQLEIGEDVQLALATGRRRKMTSRDLTEILMKAPKTRDGRYRATASLALPGKDLGPPRYYAVRSDDPNDVVPHEHRRDQRGLHVIDAWVDHDDSRAINSIDILVREGGRQFVRHYQLDFGSTLGSATEKANSPRSGAYFFGWKDSARQFFTLGVAAPYWAFADYPDFPSVGKFEWKVFDPERWLPEYPNPAFRNRLPDDEFWGAKLVTAFSNDEIRAVVSAGELSDKRAENWLVECLVERRNKIGRAYFAKLLPFDSFAIKASELVWDDVGARLGYTPAAQVEVAWERFDNMTGSRSPISEARTRGIPRAALGYLVATLKSRTRPSQRIEVFVQISSSGPRVVGVERFW
jgi:hypothetical protein